MRNFSAFQSVALLASLTIQFQPLQAEDPVARIYSTIAEELRTQYNLGYTPERKDESEGYHKIKLTAKGKDYSVQARDGYYAEQ